MSSTSTYKIDPLNGDNYTAWQQRLEWILDDLELWDVTTGAELMPMPADSAAVTAAEKQAIVVWKKQDKKAHKEICLRISDEYLVYMNESPTVLRSRALMPRWHRTELSGSVWIGPECPGPSKRPPFCPTDLPHSICDMCQGLAYVILFISSFWS